MIRRAIVPTLLILLSGCAKRPPRDTSTETSGAATIPVSEELGRFVADEADEFDMLYPNARISLVPTTAREAIVDLLDEKVRTICIDRSFNDEEWGVTKKAGLTVVENRFAEDALAVIVHPSNRMDEIPFDVLKRIVASDIASWRGIPGSAMDAPVELVLTGKNSGMYELLQRQFFHIAGDLTPGRIVGTQREIITYVAAHPAAIGFVSVVPLRESHPPVRVVRVESTDISDSRRFVGPNQMDIYHSLYPLHYSLYLYSVGDRAGVGSGFGTFTMSNTGQKIVQDYGLVPVKIPSRVIQINPE